MNRENRVHKLEAYFGSLPDPHDPTTWSREERQAKIEHLVAKYLDGLSPVDRELFDFKVRATLQDEEATRACYDHSEGHDLPTMILRWKVRKMDGRTG